jgi:UDP-N-acetylmuramoylalanine--D-glutamate ligase
MEVAGKKALVVGMGRSGLAVCRFLSARGAAVVGTDNRPRDSFDEKIDALEKMGAAFIFGSHDEETFRRADFIVLSPGVPPDIKPLLAAEEAGVAVMSEIELAYRFNKGRLIGITGTKGKSTTTTLVGRILKEGGYDVRVGGNIGFPFIDFVDTSTPASVTVIELSSFQLEKIHDFRPDLAYLLSLFPDHLDRYPSYESYVAAKKRIWMNMTEAQSVVVNGDDPACVSLAKETAARKIFFSTRGVLNEGFGMAGSGLCRFREGKPEPLLDAGLVQLKGRHSLANVLAACAVTDIFPVPAAALIKAVSAFEGLEHCLEYAGSIDGRDFYNDSKATNAEAVREGLSAFDGRVLLIMGGQDKGSDFSILTGAIREKVGALFLIGEARGKLAETYRGLTDITLCDSLEEAVKRAFQVSSGGDTILLGPGCASFDMFRDYAHRGSVFKEAVGALKTAVNHG